MNAMSIDSIITTLYDCVLESNWSNASGVSFSALLKTLARIQFSSTRALKASARWSSVVRLRLYQKTAGWLTSALRSFRQDMPRTSSGVTTSPLSTSLEYFVPRCKSFRLQRSSCCSRSAKTSSIHQSVFETYTFQTQPGAFRKPLSYTLFPRRPNMRICVLFECKDILQWTVHDRPDSMEFHIPTKAVYAVTAGYARKIARKTFWRLPLAVTPMQTSNLLANCSPHSKAQSCNCLWWCLIQLNQALITFADAICKSLARRIVDAYLMYRA